MDAPLNAALSWMNEWLAWTTRLPLWGGLVLVALGLVWLLQGARLFRFLLVGLGALAGWGAGSALAVRFGLDQWWLAVPGALVAGGLAWPLWQVALFALGGALGLWAAANLLEGADLTRFERVAAWLVAAVGSGALAVWAMNALAVLVTAVLGAVLTLLGLSALAADWTLAGAFRENGVLVWTLVGVLTVLGLLVQVQTRRSRRGRGRGRRDDDTVEVG